MQTNPAWRHYPDTVLDINGVGSVDLARAIAADTPLPFDRQPFGVITAHNPRGVTQPAQTNTAVDARLAHDLSQRGWPMVRATGRSPDAVHAEAGFAVRCAREELLALARAYHQAAIFWFDGDRFWIWPVSGDPVPLR